MIRLIYKGLFEIIPNFIQKNYPQLIYISIHDHKAKDKVDSETNSTIYILHKDVKYECGNNSLMMLDASEMCHMKFSNFLDMLKS